MYDRRKFISFLGKASLGAATIPPFLTGCGNTTTPSERFKQMGEKTLKRLKDLVIESLAASDQDDLLLANGLNYHTVIKWGDQISNSDSFGFNNDFTCLYLLIKVIQKMDCFG